LPAYLHHVIADDRWSGHFLLALLCSWREWVDTSRSINLNHLDCNLELAANRMSAAPASSAETSCGSCRRRPSRRG
jgi:hypothetical protein